MARSALIVRGGWEGHQPVEATDLFVPFLRAAGFEVRIEESTSVYADADLLAATDLVVQCISMSEIDRDAVQGLRAAVADGLGLAGWHGGITDSFRVSVDYLQLVGGQFVTHPGKPAAERRGDASDSFLPHRVQRTELGLRHPITRDVEDFDLVTEQYWVLHDDLDDVLATTTHPVQPDQPWRRPITSPAVWTRDWGRGRVFVATPGHDVETLRVPGLRTIIERGMLWAGRTQRSGR